MSQLYFTATINRFDTTLPEIALKRLKGYHIIIQSLSFLPCGTPISSNVFGPLPGGRALEVGAAGILGVEGLPDVGGGSGLLFAGGGGLWLSLKFC